MNFEPQTMTAAWPTLFFSYKYKNYQQNKDKLLDLIYDMSNKQNEDIDSGVSASLKSNLKESKFNFLETQTPEVQDLKLFFNNCISNIMTHGLSSTGLFNLDQNVKPAVHSSKSSSFSFKIRIKLSVKSSLYVIKFCLSGSNNKLGQAAFV